MSEISKKVNKYFECITKDELNKLLSNIMIDEHLKKVLLMKYIEKKDINYIAYITGYSRGKIEADLRKLRRKIGKLM